MRHPRLFAVFISVLLVGFFSGCLSSSDKDEPNVVARFMLEATEREQGGQVRLPRSGTVIAVAPKSLFTEYDINKCTVVDNELGKSLVFEFTSKASRDLLRMTAMNQGKRIITVINGVAVGATRIERPLGDGYILTYVEIADAELEVLAKDITRTSVKAQKDLAKKAP